MALKRYVTASRPQDFDGRPDRRSLYSRAKRALECGGLTPLSARDVFLVEAMCNQAAGAFQKLPIFIAEGIQFIALDIEHTKNVTVLITHRHNDLGASGMKGGQISRVFVHVAHDDRFTRIQRCAA